ncbi:hypothetical protein R515_04200 [Salmonella enterica subsp. arizonae serovar 41:z4,z23:-]|nr:hypothetical protein R515_04200 [Salmonella enterica subsp. arizonae serovar 41:z4,z23:-]
MRNTGYRWQESARLYTSSSRRPLCWLRMTRPIPGPRPDGRRKRRSNLFQTDLSLTRITYLSKLIGMSSLAALMQLECFCV